MSIKNKKDVFAMLVFYTSFFLSISICETAIECPNVSIENGSSRVISCKSDRYISDFYWYRGHYRAIPILILDSEGKGGAEYGSDHFDISSNGSMILKNVMVEHESNYTFVGFYKNEEYETATFLVNVTIPPDPRCPLVHGCEPCIECELFDVKKTGTLMCEIEGARPLIPLAWNITFNKGIYFVRHHSEEISNPQSDSWDTSVLLDYTIEENCGVFGEINCVAEDSANILQSRILTVSIRTDLCQTAITADDVLSRTSPTFIIVACLAAGILVVGFNCIMFSSYNKYGQRSLLRDGFKEQLTLLWPTKDREVDLLTRSLKKSYEKYCKLMPLPWDGVCIPVADLYTECQCLFGGKNISSADLINERGIKLGQRVILIGEHGSGRTTLTKYLVHRWIQDSTCLLIYVPLREVTKEMTLSQFVKNNDLTADISLDADAIERVLACGRTRCLVILDGYEDLSKAFRGSITDKAGEDINIDDSTYLSPQMDKNVTISDLLNGKLNSKYSNLHIWLTSRGVDYRLSKIYSPGNTTVELKGFSEKQLFHYIAKCVAYYSKNRSLDTNEDDVSKPYWSSKEYAIVKAGGSLKNETKKMYQRVVNFIFENDCVTDFQETPLLLNITIHLLACKYTSAIGYMREKVITNRNELMRNLIDCMEERYCKKNDIQDRNFTHLEQTVGEFAFKYRSKLRGKMERKSWEKEFSDQNYVQMSLDIGLLKLSQESVAGTADTEEWAPDSSKIEFYHEHIQDYLVARYMVSKNDCFGTLQEADEMRCTVFIYMSSELCLNKEDSQFQLLCEYLHKCQNYDALIDCLLETGKYSVLETAVGNKIENHISINGLGSTYHRKAVWTFCQKCKELEIELSSLSFNPDDHLSFITNLSLPKLSRVGFHHETTVSESDLSKICEWLSKHQLKIIKRFEQCRFREGKRKFKNILSKRPGTEGGDSPVELPYIIVAEKLELEDEEILVDKHRPDSNIEAQETESRLDPGIKIAGKWELEEDLETPVEKHRPDSNMEDKEMECFLYPGSMIAKKRSLEGKGSSVDPWCKNTSRRTHHDSNIIA